jgi:putative ABC transport system substrate-binding protein
MDRRRFLRITAAAAFAAPLAAKGQAVKAPRIAVVVTTSPVSDLTGPEPANPAVRAFVARLRELGWTEGRDIAFEFRSAEGRPERYPEIMAELIRIPVAAIVTGDNASAPAAAQATRSIPIVMGAAGYPVDAGLVANLARPGGNLTGFILIPDAALLCKQLQLLKEVAPAIGRVAVIHQTPIEPPQLRDKLESQARTLRITLLWTAVDRLEAFPEVLVTIRTGRADALFALPTVRNFAWRRELAELAEKTSLPALYGHTETARAGGLIAYAASVADNYRRAAEYVDRILRGARPADLPIQEPVKFDLVVNLRAAKALGIKIPSAVLARADEVID